MIALGLGPAKTYRRRIIILSTVVASVTIRLIQELNTVFARPKNAAGQALSGKTIVYSSSVPTVSTVNSSTGVITPVGVGTTLIKATVNAIDSPTITVTNATIAITGIVKTTATGIVTASGT
jgi:hypothetical protein